jgi:nicotinamidase-related amidase
MVSHPNLLCATNSSLVVVDVQTKLIAAMSDLNAEMMLTNIGILISAAHRLTIPVLITEQYPKGLGRTVTELLNVLDDTDTLIEKTSFSACALEVFNEALKSALPKQIILVGMEAHVCVLQTALELTAQGYQVYVVEDAIGSRKAEHKFYGMERMQQQGITVINHESVLFEWLRDSTHSEFKCISGLLQ